MVKTYTLIFIGVLISFNATAQFGNFLNKVVSVAETINATSEQKQATATLSEQLKNVYKSFIESCTYNDISTAVGKAKALDVSGCPTSIQEKYKVNSDLKIVLFDKNKANRAKSRFVEYYFVKS